MKDAWKGLKLLTGQKEGKKASSLTSTPGSADRLNLFYSRFDNKDYSSIHQTQKSDLEKRKIHEAPITITEEDVYKVLKEINTNKATGPDKISGRIVKQCTTSLLYIIHSIFNISLDLCRMPNLWKIGEIIPVNKKPLPKVDNDLRPVTLTAILAKCFERVILPKISSHTKPIMDKLQFAYLPNRSTDDATTTLIHELSQHLDHKSKSKYARCLFIDYSSAFNTMQPHTLINRLAEYNIPARLQLFVLDFLTDRKQYVRTEIELSSTTSINTGAPQGCVLSAFLFIIYTNALSLCSTTCKIIKYADDTVVIGLINNDNEQGYRDTVSYVSSWCNENHLNLNAGKTKELIFDFRKIQNDKAPIIINNTSVKQVPSYKYLGVIIQNNLKWNEHVTAQVKKADQRMYHVRRLSKLKIDNEILCLFYNSTVSSVLVYAVPCWFNLCDKKQKKEVCKFAKRMTKMTGDCNKVENPRMISTKKCKSLISKMLKDETHPLYPYITTLPHGHLRVPWSRTERFRKSFLPYAIKLFNSDWYKLGYKLH